MQRGEVRAARIAVGREREGREMIASYRTVRERGVRIERRRGQRAAGVRGAVDGARDRQRDAGRRQPLREIEAGDRAGERDRRAVPDVAQRIARRQRQIPVERNAAVIAAHAADGRHDAPVRLHVRGDGADVVAAIARVRDFQIAVCAHAGM